MQIEHVDAVRNLEAIVAVDGVDAIVVDPNDLSGSVGLLGQTGHAEVRKLCDRIAEVAKRRGIPFGTSIGDDPETVRQWIERGVDWIATGGDTGSLLAGAGARSSRRGEWGRFTGADVWRRTIGVVGTGRISSALMRRARGFDLRILCHDLRPEPALAGSLGAEYVPLDRLLAGSDFVTLHCALNEGTRGLIGLREIGLMKPGALLVNTARAGIVDEAALADALREKRLGGYAVDVYDPAPPPRDWPLFAFPNVIATPWMASYTPDNLARMEIACAENVVRVLSGMAPVAAVNVPAAP